jgi:hypothetical protein
MYIQDKAMDISEKNSDIKINTRYFATSSQLDIDILEDGIDNLSVTIDLTGMNAITRLTRVKELLDRLGSDKVES